MSNEAGGSRSRLRLIRGGSSAGRFRGLRIVVAPAERPPFAIDARVIEDDTYFVLGADAAFHEPEEHPLRIWTAVHDTTAVAPGSVHLVPGRPPRLLAVVHELSEDPSWRSDWVAAALGGVLQHVQRLRLRGLGLPLLGRVHGRFPAPRFLVLLRAALKHERPASLERLWLITRPSEVDDVERWVELGF